MSSEDEATSLPVTDCSLSDRLKKTQPNLKGSRSHKCITGKKNRGQAHKSLRTAHKTASGNDQWMIPQSPSPYTLGSKKRHNGDKAEQTARTKRTCPSDRLVHAEKKNIRRKGVHETDKIYFDDCSDENSDVTHYKNVRQGHQNEPSNDFCQKCYKSSNTLPESELHCSSSSSSCSDDRCALALTNGLQMSDENLDILSQPSTSKFGLDICENSVENQNGSNSPKGVRFIDSDSDEGVVTRHRSALKGGRPFPEPFIPSRRVGASRACKNIVKPVINDDSEDDDSDGIWRRRHCHATNLLLSDSEDSNDVLLASQRKQVSKSSVSTVSSTDSTESSISGSVLPSRHIQDSSSNRRHRCPILDSDDSGCAPLTSQRKLVGKAPLSETSSTDSTGSSASASVPHHARGVPGNRHLPNFLLSDSEDSSDRPSTSKKKQVSKVLPEMGECSVNTSVPPPHVQGASGNKKTGSNSSSIHSHFKPFLNHSSGHQHNENKRPISYSGSHNSSSVRLRSRFSHHDGIVRRTDSPHPRTTRSRRQQGLSRSAASQMVSHKRSRPPDFATRFPDIFDAEDSSEVEFFTANSYSDTETCPSAVDSRTNLDASLTAPDPSDFQNSTISVGSSDEDCASSYPSTAHFVDTNSRRNRHRGSGRRQRSYGRRSVVAVQERSSVSPDPVEQVRQLEEDEQFARRLQAQFDAEVSGPADVAQSQESSDSEVGMLMNDLLRDFPTPESNRTNILHELPIRIRGTFSQERGRGGRSMHQRYGDPWMWQFARILGLGPTQRNQDIGNADYEALLQLVETVGDAVPRGLRKTEINRLPTRKFYIPGFVPSTSQSNEDIVHKRTELNKECQVCLCDYENGDVLRILPCFHEFHTPCIDPWLKVNRTCPVCRVQVTFDE